jgi:hypothetical protein
VPTLPAFCMISANKKKAYREYRETKKDMQEIVTVVSIHLPCLPVSEMGKYCSNTTFTELA